MLTTTKGSSASYHLDLIRGLSALAVVLFHVRYRFFLDFHDVGDLSQLQKSFYVATAFGHDAVMIFFVLSGYFISSTVVRDHRQNRWSWPRYMANRMTRLYVVLIPGLLLTAFWDRLGMSCFPGHAIYSGDVAVWQQGYGFSVPGRSTWTSLVGNLLFLQSVRVPPYGSNDALWSLSYEFWYYVLFPCAWIVLGLGATTSWRKRAACGALIAAVCCVVNSKLLLYFPVWLLGTAVCLVPTMQWRRKSTLGVLTLLSMAIFAAALMFAHSGALNGVTSNPVLAMDYCTAGGFALFLYFLVQDKEPSRRGLYSRMAVFLAGLSYTLYVVHMPFLTFLRAALIPAEPWAPSALAVAVGALILAAAVGYAAVVWFFTEARTALVRDALVLRLRALGGDGTQNEVRVAATDLRGKTETVAEPSAIGQIC